MRRLIEIVRGILVVAGRAGTQVGKEIKVTTKVITFLKNLSAEKKEFMEWAETYQVLLYIKTYNRDQHEIITFCSGQVGRYHLLQMSRKSPDVFYSGYRVVKEFFKSHGIRAKVYTSKSPLVSLLNLFFS